MQEDKERKLLQTHVEIADRTRTAFANFFFFISVKKKSDISVLRDGNHVKQRALALKPAFAQHNTCPGVFKTMKAFILVPPTNVRITICKHCSSHIRAPKYSIKCHEEKLMENWSEREAEHQSKIKGVQINRRNTSPNSHKASEFAYTMLTFQLAISSYGSFS